MGSPVSPVEATLYMDFLKGTANTTAPGSFKPKLWKRYMDDILELILLDEVEQCIVPTGYIKFAHESEEGRQLLFPNTEKRRWLSET